MDRTMYGKIDPGARNPYRVALKREKGISPGCKCLEHLFFFYFQENHLTIITAISFYIRHTNQSINQSSNTIQSKMTN